VAYSCATLTTLLALGRLSNHVGRRPTSMASLALLVLGCLLFLDVHVIGVLIAARLLMGLGAGLASSSLASYIVDAAPARPAWSASVAWSQTVMLGLAPGPVKGSPSAPPPAACSRAAARPAGRRSSASSTCSATAAPRSALIAGQLSGDVLATADRPRLRRARARRDHVHRRRGTDPTPGDPVESEGDVTQTHGAPRVRVVTASSCAAAVATECVGGAIVTLARRRPFSSWTHTPQLAPRPGACRQHSIGGTR
jgi:hypothetical protein